MTLRSRLFLTTLLIAVPLAITLFLVEDRIRLSAMEQELRRSVAFDLSAGLQQRCESDPPRIGRPGRGGGPPPPPRFPGRARGGTPPPNGRGPGPGNGGYEFFAYDATGRPTAADAPPLPDSRDGERAMYFWSGLGRGVGRVVPLGGEGPCAFLLARIPPRPGELRDQAEALAFACCVAEGLSQAGTVAVVASMGVAPPADSPHDTGVQERLEVFAWQLKTAPPGVLVPQFVFRDAPYIKGHCHACGEALERVRWGSCWRCSVARRLVCGAPVPADLLSD